MYILKLLRVEHFNSNEHFNYYHYISYCSSIYLLLKCLCKNECEYSHTNVKLQGFYLQTTNSSVLAWCNKRKLNVFEECYCYLII